MVKEILGKLFAKLKTSKRNYFFGLCICIVGFSYLSHHGRSSHYVDKGLPPLNTTQSLIPRLTPIVQLFRHGTFYCTAFVIGNNYALTASHCLVDEDGNKADDEIDIRLLNKATGTKAKAVAVDFRRDLGLIQGDFSKFEMIDVSNDHPGFDANAPLIACGYPGGNKHVSCTSFIPVMTDQFFLKGPGLLVGGMSGGPVINLLTNQAIGVNCHVYEAIDGGGVGISSLYGVLGDFGIEP